MIIRPAKELFLEGNDTAILFLHSYTSHTRDMKKLAEFLHKHIGCTCYVPLYEGHGGKPEDLLTTNINDWWRNSLDAYYFLQQKGYKKISLIGLSLGGVFSLKLAQKVHIERIIVMSVPNDRTPKRLKQRLIDYSKAYKQLEGKTPDEIAKELIPFQEMPLFTFGRFQNFIHQTMDHVSQITAPVAIYYGEKDDSLYEVSANYIFDNITSKEKQKKSFPNSTHLMTLGKDKKSLFEEVLTFMK